MTPINNLLENKVAKWFLVFGYLICFIVIGWISFGRHDFYKETIENFNDYRTLAILISFVILIFVYYLYFNGKEQINSKHIFPFLIAIVALCFIIPPFFSADISAYLLAAKNAFVYHLNPYLTPYAEVKNNPWLQQIGDIWWLKYPTAYGPLFTLISGIPILFTRDLVASIYLYKFVVLVAFAATFYLIYAKLPIEKEKRKLLALMFALNPAILIHFVLESHNDIFVILFFVASFISFSENKRIFSFFSLIGSALIKYSTLAMLPVFWFCDKKFSITRALMSTLITVILALLFVLISRIYESPLYFEQLRHMSTDCLYACNPYHQIIHLLPRTLGGYLNYSIVICLYLLVAYRYLIKDFSFLKFSFWVSFIVIFILTSWDTPWYPVLLITIGILINEKKYHYLVYILTFYSLLHICLPF